MAARPDHDFEFYDSDASSEENDFSSDDEDEEEFLNAYDDIFGSSDEEEDTEFEGFAYQLSKKVNWTEGKEPILRPFERRATNVMDEAVKNPGIQVQVNASSQPFDLFKLFLTVEFVRDVLVKFTNLNAKMKRQQNGDKGKWVETTVDEIFAFLACLIIMNDFIALPNIQSYFATDKRNCFCTPTVSEKSSKDIDFPSSKDIFMFPTQEK